jgi:quercetin dioxygenase-like cupin family protein
MTITRNVSETGRGPADWFTGDVYIDTLATPSDASRIGAACVHFPPGARTAWHTHPHGQTIWVTEGVGLCQREDGPIEVIRPGDRVFFEPGESHWHGSSRGADTSATTSTRRRPRSRGANTEASGTRVCRSHHRRTT